MHRKKLIAGALVAVVAAFTLMAGAQDAPSTRPAASAERGQVVRPYNLLDDLTAEQQDQLRLIRGEYLAVVREARRLEREKSMAVLTEAQRARLAEVEADRRAEAAERRAERRAEGDDDEEDAGEE